MKKIISVDGAKGGVGKSFFTTCLVDTAKNYCNKDFLLIEAKKALKISLPFLDQFGTGFGKSEVSKLSNEFKEWMESDRHEP